MYTGHGVEAVCGVDVSEKCREGVYMHAVYAGGCWKGLYGGKWVYSVYNDVLQYAL